MSKESYLNEVKERLVFRLSEEFKNEDLIRSIVDHHFSSLQEKFFPNHSRVRTKDYLIRLFTSGGKPYALKYKILGHQRDQWKADKIILDEMIREKTVRIIERTRNSILYSYDPQKFLQQ